MNPESKSSFCHTDIVNLRNGGNFEIVNLRNGGNFEMVNLRNGGNFKFSSARVLIHRERDTHLMRCAENLAAKMIMQDWFKFEGSIIQTKFQYCDRFSFFRRPTLLHRAQLTKTETAALVLFQPLRLSQPLPLQHDRALTRLPFLRDRRVNNLLLLLYYSQA